MNYTHGQLNYPIFAYAHTYASGSFEAVHEHDRIQLLHTLSGVLHVQTKQGTWVIPPSKGIWIPANQPHAIKAYGQVQARGVFIDRYASADLQARCQVISVPRLLAELINSALDIRGEIHPHSRNERLLQLILDEVRFLNALPFQLPEAQSCILKDICQSILQRLNQQLSLEQLSCEFHLSTRTISRYFHKEMQMSFSHWLRQARLLQALTDLVMHKPILNTALDLGYESPSAFTSMFKREMGITPSEYIKRHMNELSDSR